MTKKVIYVTDPTRLVQEYVGETTDGSHIDVTYINLANEWIPYSYHTTIDTSLHSEIFSNYKELFREKFLAFL